MRLSVSLVLAILLSSAAISRAADQDNTLNPDQLVGAWRLVCGERDGKAMDKTRTGAIYVFTKDTLTGKDRYGEEKAWMSYTLDTKQTPAAMNLTITKGFAGESREAIVDMRDGQLRLCYNLDKKGRPKAFETKEGENNRSMTFVKSVDPAVLQKEVQSASEKRWAAVRDQDVAAFATAVLNAEFNRTGPDTKRRTFTEVVFETLNNPNNKLDSVVVSDQVIRILGDTAVETGRAVGTKKDVKEPVWDIRYTATWVREDGKWWIINEHQSPAKQ